MKQYGAGQTYLDAGRRFVVVFSVAVIANEVALPRSPLLLLLLRVLPLLFGVQLLSHLGGQERPGDAALGVHEALRDPVAQLPAHLATEEVGVADAREDRRVGSAAGGQPVPGVEVRLVEHLDLPGVRVVNPLVLEREESASERLGEALGNRRSVPHLHGRQNAPGLPLPLNQLVRIGDAQALHPRAVVATSQDAHAQEHVLRPGAERQTFVAAEVLKKKEERRETYRKKKGEVRGKKKWGV